MNNETLLIVLVVFVALTGVALTVQAIVMLVAVVKMRKTVASLHEDFHEMRTAVMPILTKSKELLENVAPKVESIAADVADLTQRLKQQGVEVQATTADILDRVHRQTSRVDTIVTGVIDGIEHAGNVVADSVGRPVRQIGAMLSSAKAFLSVLATGRRPGQRQEIVADQDMFV
jgi:uncharacterized protein YoxC